MTVNSYLFIVIIYCYYLLLLFISKYLGIRCHFYTDDIQIHISFAFGHASSAVFIIIGLASLMFSLG